MHQLILFLSIIIIPLVSSIRMKREAEKSQSPPSCAHKVDKFIEVGAVELLFSIV